MATLTKTKLHQLANAIDAVRVHVISTRRAHRSTLSAARDNTLYEIECILNSLQVEVEEDANSAPTTAD